MAGKKKELHLQVAITNQEHWDEVMSAKGLTVVDVYQDWCGPCKAVLSLFRKLKTEIGDELLHFAVAEASHFHTLDPFNGKCEPVFLFYSGGKAVAIVKGVNGPLLQKTILEHVQEVKKQQEVGDKCIEALVQEIPLLENTLEVPPNEDAHGQEDKEAKAEQRGLNDKEVVDLSDDSYTVAIIKPDAVSQGKVDEIKNKIQEAGFILVTEEQRHLTEEQARDFCLDQAGQSEFEDLVKFISSGLCHVLILSRGIEADKDVPAWKELIEHSDVEFMKAPPSGPILALALTREDAVQHCRNLLGPKKLEDAKEKAPESLRAEFALENIPINQLNGSSSPEEAKKDLEFFFPVEQTLAVIKPDAYKEHKDEILSNIKEAGFSISQMKETVLTKEMAEGFYKDHRGKPFFDHLVQYMSQGPSMMIILSKENAVQEWRDMMGPTDPELAKQFNPNSLRAQFAKSILENAMHGSSNVEHAKKNINLIFENMNLE
ncbi:thioredoxin domain-containing protein 3 homolog [Polyodon spathula]|uniref:thioredoxin domain-containing protein 3 homolog n=1 Tax=Polyodon spathula TaxID=7913 RepID=UPI001B7F5C14|nr:thioredoxin domain-containing protein 3 homolog [Polyodon spathula]